MDLTDPTTATLVVANAIRDAGYRAAVYGGLALAAYGIPRETKDADYAVAGLAATEALAALRAARIEVILAFEGLKFGGNTVTRITLLGADDATGLNVADFVEPRSRRYAEVALDRATVGHLRDQEITVLRPLDFILFKILSTRDRDLEDAASVRRLLGDRFDIDAVRAEAGRLASEIPDHDVAGRLERMLTLPPPPPDSPLAP